jgi:hypothetical protein
MIRENDAQHAEMTAIVERLGEEHEGMPKDLDLSKRQAVHDRIVAEDLPRFNELGRTAGLGQVGPRRGANGFFNHIGLILDMCDVLLPKEVIR